MILTDDVGVVVPVVVGVVMSHCANVPSTNESNLPIQ